MTPAMIGTSMPALARRGDEVPVGLVVEEELGDQEGRAGVDLRLEKRDVGLEARRLGMDLGEAGAPDREVEVARDQRRELRRRRQPALGRLELGLTPRRVAAQGEDVLDPPVAEPLEDLANAVDRLPDAAQVGHRLDPMLALDRGRDLDACRRGSLRRRRRSPRRNSGSSGASVRIVS